MKLTISGKPKSGKTSLALLIGKFLSDHGASVKFGNLDDRNPKIRKDSWAGTSIEIEENFASN